MIEELDRIILTADLPDEGLEAGDVGTVVLVHQSGTAYEVEFFTTSGDTFTVATVPANQLQRGRRDQVSHARAINPSKIGL